MNLSGLRFKIQGQNSKINYWLPNLEGSAGNRKLGGMHLFFSNKCTIRDLLWCSDEINTARCGAGGYKIARDLKIKLNTNECLKPDLCGWHYRSLSAGKQQADLFASFIGCKKDQRISFLQANRFIGLHDSDSVPS